MKIINILLIIAVCFCFSCDYKGNTDNLFSLKQSEISLSFPIDESTKTFIQALFLWEDENRNEYLTFQNQGKNEILFYNIKSQELMFKIKPEVSGNNGVGFL